MGRLVCCNATLEVFTKGELADLARSGALTGLTWEQWWPLRSASRADPALQPSFEERAKAVAAAGFDAIGINNSVYRLDLTRLQRDAAFLRGLNLEVAAIETPGLWFVDHEDVLAQARIKEEELFTMAAAFGCRRALANTFAPDLPSLPMEAAVERFGELCDRAAPHGITIGIEFVIGTLIGSLGEAWELVSRSGRPNSGIIFDAFSFFRGGGTFEELRAVPASSFVAVQIADAEASSSLPPLEEAMRRRLRPGAGAFDLVGLIRTLDEMGVDADYEVEVFADRYRGSPVDEAALKACEATMLLLEKARAIA